APDREPDPLAGGTVHHRDPGPGVRVHPVHDPAPVRGPGSDRPVGARGLAGPGRHLVPDVPAGHAAVVEAGDPGRQHHRRPADVRRIRDWLANPWSRPRFLVLFTILYFVWSLLPVALAVLFSFNSGRSRSTWQGFSFRWYWGDPNLSVFHDDTMRTALIQS